jgi:hypothetical protein
MAVIYVTYANGDKDELAMRTEAKPRRPGEADPEKMWEAC